MKKIKGLLTMIIAGIPAFLSFAACATAGADPDPAASTGTPFGNFISKYGIWILLGVLILAFFFFSGSRRKKQAQESQNMLDSIRPGVYVMTQGGVIGKVVEVITLSPTEKHVVLETGGEENKSCIKYDIRAIGMVLRPDQLVPRAPAAEAVLPTDEEVQKRLEDVYSAPAEEKPVEEKAAETTEEKTEEKSE